METSVVDDFNSCECIKHKVEKTEHNSNCIFVIKSYMNQKRHQKKISTLIP